MATGQPLVLIHAFPVNARLWRHQVAAAPPGMRVIAPDLPGFGASPLPPAASIDRMARAVLDVMDAQGVQRATIGGLSMGGYVAFAMYRQAPERFSGIILADTRATADTEQQKDGRRRMIAAVREKGPSAVADEMLPKLLGETSRRERPAVAAEVREMIESNPAEAIAGALDALMGRPDSTELLSGIDVPALVICGDQDGLTPPSEAESLHRAIRGSRLEIVNGAGHLSCIEAPAAFSSALFSFLTSTQG